MVHWKSWALAWAAAVALTAHAQIETLVVKRSTELRQGPSETTANVAALAAQTSVTRLPERQGPWMRVKTESGQIGWLHMFDVGTAAQQSAAGSTATSALRGLSNLFGGGSNNTNKSTVTATVGIRGLGAEDIANAQPNLDALKRAEALRVDATQAKRYAGESQWAARTVEPLPTPQPPAAPATTSDAGVNSTRGGSK
jgi:hypothetical protein